MTSPGRDRSLDVPARRTKAQVALARVANLGSTAQASVPGVYAWSVTVAPAAFARGGSWFAQGAAAGGIASLAGALVLEGKHPRAARLVSVWGLVFTSLLVWIAAPSSSLSPPRIDVVWGLAGMLGWALFALASAAPPIGRPSFEPAVSTSSRALRSRGRGRWADTVILWIGFGAAAGTEAVGWHVVEPERAVLVRLLGLAGALAAIGVADSIVGAHHMPRKFDSPGRRARRALVPLILLAFLAAGGALIAFVPIR